eukprot:7829328-Heterocapsa_arctica.AAC.1
MSPRYKGTAIRVLDVNKIHPTCPRTDCVVEGGGWLGFLGDWCFNKASGPRQAQGIITLC